MSYQFKFTRHVLGKLEGFPADALGVLAETVAVVLEDPYDMLHSTPTGKDPRERLTVLGDTGFFVFEVDDDAMTVTLTELLWAG